MVLYEALTFAVALLHLVDHSILRSAHADPRYTPAIKEYANSLIQIFRV
jgi:hypothetical protein